MALICARYNGKFIFQLICPISATSSVILNEGAENGRQEAEMLAR